MLDFIKTKIISENFDYEEILLTPILATLLALIIGCVFLLATGESFSNILLAFSNLFIGAFGSLNAISETCTAATPLILAALGISLAFRAGLFNIGAEGQIIIGGIATVIIGFSIDFLPIWLHLPIALLFGAIFGALYAAIAGWLKASTGAHEVISTIMLNLIALRLLDYLLRLPIIQKEGRNDPISKSVLETAQLPQILSFIEPQLRIHSGFIIMLFAVFFVYWLLFHTTIGFEFRSTGANPNAAQYAGIKASLTIVLVMGIAGALAGLAGANQITGVLGRATPGFSASIGFDAIAVALLGRSHPFGVLFAGLLFGALVAGGRLMQVKAGVSIDLITIIQALIIVFIAAPLLVKNTVPWAFKSKKKS